MIFRKTRIQLCSFSFAASSRALATLAIIGAGSVPGCASAPGPLFERKFPPPAWPANNKTPRIEWVGAISTSQDLKPARTTLDAIGELFVGKEAPTKLQSPRSVYVTPDGERIWVADPGDHSIHVFDLATRKHTRVDRVAETIFLSPIALSRGRPGAMYLCDSQSVAIYELSDTDGKLIRALQLGSDVLRPVGVFFDANNDELFVVDVSGHDIKVLSPNGDLLRVIGHRGESPGEFNYPSAIGGKGDQLWIADSGNHRVQGISKNGEPFVSFGRAGDAPGDLALPKTVALDADGHVYVVDSRFENVQVFNDRGQLLLYFGEEGHGPGQFWLPGGIFIEQTGRIWICDPYNQRVQIFQYIKDTGDVH